jgi:hypothetical protein
VRCHWTRQPEAVTLGDVVWGRGVAARRLSGCDQLCVDALAIVDETLLKIVLILVATPGMMAPAATATNPAIKAYSIRSWPRASFQMTSFNKNRVKCFM